MSFAGRDIVENPITVNFFYNILLGSGYHLLGFYVGRLEETYFVPKVQKSTSTMDIFEIALLLTLGYDFIELPILEAKFNIGIIVLACFSIILVFNLKWIAYLNFKQKWKGILFIVLSGIYLYHFFQNLVRFSDTEVLVMDLLERVFVLGLFWGFYSFTP